MRKRKHQITDRFSIVQVKSNEAEYVSYRFSERKAQC